MLRRRAEQRRRRQRGGQKEKQTKMSSSEISQKIGFFKVDTEQQKRKRLKLQQRGRRRRPQEEEPQPRWILRQKRQKVRRQFPHLEKVVSVVLDEPHPDVSEAVSAFRI